tara:strand:- start:409 stop:996 length:588 start_codon:yes stop_codon:yes gene_type:complete
MKPVKDIFSSHIDSLYNGHEVEAPASIQGAVFKNLDAIKGGASGGLVSGGFSSKAVLGAACVIVGFAWYLMPVSEDQIVIEDVVIIEEVIIEEPVIEEPVIEEPVIEEAIPVVPFIEDSSVEIDVVEAEVDEIAPVQTIVSEPVVEPAILVQELEPATEPVIIVEEPVIDVVKVKETQEPKEVLEWVLPAKLEVD